MPKPTGSSLEQLARRTAMFLDVLPLPKHEAYRKEAKAIKLEMDRVVQAFAQIDGDLFSAKVERAAEALAAASRTNTVAWAAFTNEQREYYRGVVRVVLSAVGLTEGGR